MVSSSSEFPVTSARSGFGRSGVERGQKREPMPPANTTAQSTSPVASATTPAGSGSCSVPLAAPPAKTVNPPVLERVIRD